MLQKKKNLKRKEKQKETVCYKLLFDRTRNREIAAGRRWINRLLPAFSMRTDRKAEKGMLSLLFHTGMSESRRVPMPIRDSLAYFSGSLPVFSQKDGKKSLASILEGKEKTIDK